MVKVTGGGRNTRAIAAHFRYISKNGRLQLEDERGQWVRGRDAISELVEDWRFGGSLIGDVSPRREALNIMLSMPRGTDPLTVRRAAREFARDELRGHKYVMVLHDHQANPHVHISVRVESMRGQRLNPRKADLQRWRETFAERLQELGVDAEATRQASRGTARRHESLWRLKAREAGRFSKPRTTSELSGGARRSRRHAAEAWRQVAATLAASPSPIDRNLASSIAQFMFMQRSTGWQRSDDQADTRVLNTHL
jgi:hypothetical protein